MPPLVLSPPSPFLLPANHSCLSDAFCTVKCSHARDLVALHYGSPIKPSLQIATFYTWPAPLISRSKRNLLPRPFEKLWLFTPGPLLISSSQHNFIRCTAEVNVLVLPGLLGLLSVSQLCPMRPIFLDSHRNQPCHEFKMHLVSSFCLPNNVASQS